MRWLIPALFIACAIQAFAGEVTCSSGGVTEVDPLSCGLGPVASMLVASAPNLDGNIFAVARAGQSTAEITASGETSSGSASFNDAFAIPNSPASDVFKIAILIQTDNHLNSSAGPLFSEVKLGVGTTGYPALDYSSVDDIDNCHRLGCAFLVQAPAFAYSIVQLSGSESLEMIDSRFGGYAFSFASVAISRFTSDGVTPDPFTPEPATAGLVGAAFVALLSAAYFKRRSKTVAYS